MKYTDILDSVFNLGKTIFEADEATAIPAAQSVPEPQTQIIPREYWAKADPVTVYHVANTNSIKGFVAYIEKLADEMGLSTIRTDKQNRIQRLTDQNRITRSVPGVPEPLIQGAIDSAAEGDLTGLKQIRREARAVAQELIAVAPKHSPLRRKQLKPDTLFMSQDEKETFYQNKAKELLNRPKKQYFGDKLYGIFRKADGVRVYPPMSDPNGQAMKLPTEGDAEIFLYGNLADFPNPDDYAIQEYDNDKSLTKLKETTKPLENGWTKEEIVQALVPYCYLIAKKYRPIGGEPKQPGARDIHHFGPFENAAALGIQKALVTDRGLQPFGQYVWKFMAHEVQKEANKGVMSGARDFVGSQFGRSGNIIAWKVSWDEGDGTPHSVTFPAHVGGYEKQREAAVARGEYSKSAASGKAPKLSGDTGFQAAKEFKAEKMQQLVDAGMKPDSVKITAVRTTMASGNQPVGIGGSASGGGEGAVGTIQDLHRAKTANPLKVVTTHDYINYLMNKGQLTPEERKTIFYLYALDKPEHGMMGIPSSGRTPVQGGMKFGPPESGEEERKPGEQAGLSPHDVKRDSLGRKIKGDSAIGKYGTNRDLTDVGTMMGVSRDTVRNRYASALNKMMNVIATEKPQDKPVKGTGMPEATEELRNTVLEMFKRVHLKILLSA